MTRVNLVPVESLADQHLIAEYREISRLPKFLEKSLRSRNGILSIPKEYTFGTGHVSFFYDKLGFIKLRHEALKQEGYKRGFRLSSIDIDLSLVSKVYCNSYVPSERAILLSKGRIFEKLKMKPFWYKFYGKPISQDFLNLYL